MTELFNTKLEESLRVLLTLLAFQRPLGSEYIATVDLLTTYGKNYQILPENLHGDNTFSFSEVAARRKLVREALESLVVNGLVLVHNTNDGFLYSISPEGQKLCEEMKSDYSKEYLSFSIQVKNYCSRASEQTVIKKVRDYSIKRST
jgi:hypothetical protein